ncbi:transporter [Variovorax sp. 2RAF20]
MKVSKIQGPATAFAALCVLAAAAPTHAVEGGAPITPFGVFDFGAGMLPPPSEIVTVGIRSAFYRSNDLRDSAGKRSAVGANLNVDSVGVAVLKMTDITLLGGRYGYSAVVPVLNMGLDLAIPTPRGTMYRSGRNTAVGDVQLIPLMLQWTPMPGLFTNASLQLQLPTGSYDKERLVNAGTNHWTVTPAYAFTYITSGGFEVSSSFQLNFNGRNRATDYRSGVEWQHEFAIGQHFGPWTAGLGGYHYQQVTDDKAATLTNGNRARVTALGLAVNFLEPGSGLPAVWFHAYKEFNAKNRTQGTQIALRAAWTF